MTVICTYYKVLTQVHIGGGEKKNAFPKDPTSEFQEEELRGRSYKMDLGLLRKRYCHFKKMIEILKLIIHEYQGSHSDWFVKDNLSLNYGFSKITFIIENIYNLITIN